MSDTTDIPDLPVGTRVLIVGDHPWTGHSGEFLRFEQAPFGQRPRVRLDNGQEVFVMKPNEWKRIDTLGPRARRRANKPKAVKIREIERLDYKD